jgi:hypothetical protein
MAKMKHAQMGYRVRGEGRSCGIERQARKDERQYDRENRKANRQADKEIKRDERVAARDAKKEAKSVPKQRSGGSTPAWQRKEGKNPAGGLNAKGVASYRAANPGSKLKTAVTTKPSKLKKGSKAASRRKSFCARMSGMKKRLTSAKTANDPNSRINKSLRKWNC